MSPRFLLIQLCLLFSAIVGAEPLDIRTHDLVIEKLESALPGLSGQRSEGNVLTRLGDLYADRARLTLIKENESNCQNCNESVLNRTKAINYYQRAFSRVSAEQQPRLLLQIAHLHSSNGDIKDAKRVFTTILSNRKKYSSELVGESYAGLGEISYQEGQFETAKNQFTNALNYPLSKKSFVLYRLAWCHLNSGNIIEAKSTLLSILNQKPEIEASFRKDVTHDLATFIVRGEVTRESVDELLNLSAKADRKANLFYLGQECDRLGNKLGSVLIWDLYTKQNDLSAEDKLEVKLRLAQNLWDQNQLEESLVQYKDFYTQFKKYKCTDRSYCDELVSRSRNYIHSWIKKEKNKPTGGLGEALKTYVVNNKEDVEMLSWTAHIARRLKDNNAAVHYYGLAAETSAKLLKNQSQDGQKIKFLQSTFEGSLIAAIECAEASKSAEQKNLAYNQYLRLNPNGEKADEIRYQLTYLKYSAGDYKTASAQFYQLATSKNRLSAEAKIQAADLALDSLAIMKNHAEIERVANDFAKSFPQKKNEYAKLSRQASVNQAADSYNNGKSSTSSMKSALVKLTGATLIGASDSEKLKIYKNQMVIAEKLHDLGEVDAIAIKILSVKSASAADIDFALGRRLWVAEMRLDFKSAARIAKSSRLENLSLEERHLKLAILTELAGSSAQSYYENYLKVSKNLQQTNLVRAKMVKEARDPWSELARQKKYLQKTPNLYAQSVLQVFARTQNVHKMKTYAAESSLKKSEVSPILNRFITLDENRALDKNLSKQRLSSQSDKKIKQTLSERLALLNQADKVANKALASGDFTLQMEALNRVSKENNRLYNELLKMPIPPRLQSKQKAEYVKLLAKQAEPYKEKSEQAEKKMLSLWRSSKDYQELLRLAGSDTNITRNLVVAELSELSNWATKSTRSEIIRAIASKPSGISAREFEAAKTAISRDPFDSGKVAKLKKLEELHGSSTFAAYLEARLIALKKGNL